MKIWFGFGSEHSANLVIIGKFKDGAKASEALSLLNDVVKIARSEEESGRLKLGEPYKFSQELLDLCMAKSLPLNDNDPEELVYEHHVKQEGEKLIVTTEEMTVGAFLKVFLNAGAKIEVYSAHEHASAYGRQTHR